MSFIYTILVIIAIWYIAKLALDSTPAKKIEKYEEFADLMLGSYRTTAKVAYGLEEDEPEVTRMKDWYIRLKEKYKHDQSRLVRLAEDWKDYAYNLSRQNSSHYLWLESEDDESSKEHQDKGREAYLRVEEIENRFANELGQSFRTELDSERKRKQEEVEKFWNTDDTK